MGKLWLIEVTRELEDKFVGHMRQDTEPSQEEVIEWLSKEGIDDDPNYTKYEISEVVI